MSECPLFITAQDADKRFLNQLIIELRDYEYLDEDLVDSFTLFTSRTAYRPAKAPFLDDFTNEWAEKDIKDIESFMLEFQPPKEARLNVYNFVVIDDQAKKERNAILFDRVLDEDSNATNTFKKTRVPWYDTWLTFANLDIRNMDFEEFADKELGDGWWEHSGPARTLDEEAERKKAKALRTLKELGHA